MFRHDEPQYPISSFPEIARQLIYEIQAQTQAPPPMIGNAVLAAMALAVQAQFRVRRQKGLESPCSLAVVSICASGERKTTVDKLVHRAFLEFEAAASQEYEQALSEFRAKHLIWKAKQKDIEKRLAKALAEGLPTSSFQQALTDHQKAEPEKPRKTRFIYKDATPSALLYGLHQDIRSASLCEDEGARFFEGHMSTDNGLLNKGWDGSTLIVDRRSGGSFQICSPRLSLNLMVQPSIFKKYMEKRGVEARGIGFLARWLVCYPLTTQGYRTQDGPPPEPVRQNKFRDRIHELLAHQKSSGVFASSDAEIVLTFTPEAEEEWAKISNMIETDIRPGRAFQDSGDYASKIAENIARIAGIFHAFSGQEGTHISLETLNAATAVSSWYAMEFIRLFAPPDPLHALVEDSRILEEWLLKVVDQKGMLDIDKNMVRQYGPNSLRNSARLSAAIDELERQGLLRIARLRNGKTVLELDRRHFRRRNPLINYDV